VKYHAKRIKTILIKLGFKAKEPDMGGFIYFEHPDTGDIILIDKDVGLPEDYMRRKLDETTLEFAYFDSMYKAKK